MSTETIVNLTELKNSLDWFYKGNRAISLDKAIDVFKTLLDKYTYSCLGSHSGKYTVVFDHKGFVKEVDTVNGPVNLNAVFWNLRDYHKKHKLDFSELSKVEYNFTI